MPITSMPLPDGTSIQVSARASAEAYSLQMSIILCRAVATVNREDLAERWRRCREAKRNAELLLSEPIYPFHHRKAQL